MENITIGQISAGLVFLVALSSALAYFLKPVKEFSRRIDKIEKHQDNDNERLNMIQKDEKMILKCLNAILLHMESGNDTGELRRQKQELDDYIINR